MGKNAQRLGILGGTMNLIEKYLGEAKKRPPVTPGHGDWLAKASDKDLVKLFKSQKKKQTLSSYEWNMLLDELDKRKIKI